LAKSDFRFKQRKCQNSCAGQGWGFKPRRAATGCQVLIGEFETAGVIGISLVAESSTDHIEKAVCTNSAWIFSETVGGMKFKFGEEIEQQLSDR